jgi:hypothetical protein
MDHATDSILSIKSLRGVELGFNGDSTNNQIAWLVQSLLESPLQNVQKLWWPKSIDAPRLASVDSSSELLSYFERFGQNLICHASIHGVPAICGLHRSNSTISLIDFMRIMHEW